MTTEDDLLFGIARSRMAKLRAERDEAVALNVAILERISLLPYAVWMKILDALEMSIACCSNPSPRFDGQYLRCSNCNAYMTPRGKPKKK